MNPFGYFYWVFLETLLFLVAVKRWLDVKRTLPAISLVLCILSVSFCESSGGRNLHCGNSSRFQWNSIST